MSMDLELEDTMMNRYRDIGSTGSFSEKKAAEVWSQNLVETCGLSTPLHMTNIQHITLKSSHLKSVGMFT
ncbi:uncharacterized protein LOC119647564 isoform X3 [Hermetia illucens]|uniref:uncharacterized protein LOC119647564 isoform X3 n=1 Tax=Hermetia illucens TaxID=343691 RepID=UPI0018CC6F56|nr:uncharacterized protein LOC119647564 isoform X3 [Hermetia illucens]